MRSRRFPWWVSRSLILLFGTPAVYLGLVLRVAEPDGLADVGGCCIGILLMPLGFLSLVTLIGLGESSAHVG